MQEKKNQSKRGSLHSLTDYNEFSSKPLNVQLSPSLLNSKVKHEAFNIKQEFEHFRFQDKRHKTK